MQKYVKLRKIIQKIQVYAKRVQIIKKKVARKIEDKKLIINFWETLKVL